MVASPNYERLKTFMKAARANKGLDAWDRDHNEALKYFDDAVERLRSYRDGHGFTGVTGDAMDKWVDASIRRITQYKAGYKRGYMSYLNGRDIMATALSEAEKLSPSLIDDETEAMRDDWFVSVPDSKPGGGLEFMGRRYTTGAAYVEAVEAQANAQREAAAARILSMLNSRTKAVSEELRLRPATPEARKSLTEFEHEQSPGGGSTSWGYSASDDYGRAADRSSGSSNYPGGFDQPWWSEADAAAARNRVVSSGAVPTQEPAYGETGSRTNPITDPQDLMSTDLLHTRVNGTTYRNGVVGGHTPAPPADVDHPLWRLNGGAASDSATAGRLGGAGVLGAGALGLRGAARMGSGSFGGSGSLGGSSVFGRFGGAGTNGLGGSNSASGLSGAGRMGAAGMRGVTGSTNGLGASGAAGLKVGSYSGSGFGSYTPPAGTAGAGGVNGAAGSSGVTGTTGANGGGAAGAAGAAGKGGTTSGGFMGAGAGAGAGAGKDDKKGRKNRYVAFKFDDDEDELPAGYVNPLSQTSGTDKDITPAKRTDDGWDPRQW